MSLVVYALDSADIDLLQRWMAEGVLPNIAALWQRSLLARVGGPGYWDETGSWITAFSGVPATRHGYYSARRLKPGAYALEMVALSDAQARPCWELVEDPRFKAVILEPIEGVPSPGVAGAQLYNLTVHQEAYAMSPMATVPESLSETVRQIYGKRPLLQFDRFEESLGYYKTQLAEYLDVLQRKARLYRELIRRDEYQLIVVGFSEMHDAVHLLWPFHEGRSPERDPHGELAGAIRTMYVEVDREIGRIQDIVPRNSTVCLLSMMGSRISTRRSICRGS